MVTRPSAIGPLASMVQPPPAGRSAAVTSSNSKPTTRARSRCTSTGPSQSPSRVSPGVSVRSASHSARSNSGQSPPTCRPGRVGRAGASPSKRAAPRASRQRWSSPRANSSSARAEPVSMRRSVRPGRGTSSTTRVDRRSSGGLANGRGAPMPRPSRSLSTSKRVVQVAPRADCSRRPCSFHGVLPDMRTVAGRPITAGSRAPAARPSPSNRIEAVTPARVAPGLTEISNGPSRYVPLSPSPRALRSPISSSPVIRVTGSRSTGQRAVAERSRVRTEYSRAATLPVGSFMSKAKSAGPCRRQCHELLAELRSERALLQQLERLPDVARGRGLELEHRRAIVLDRERRGADPQAADLALAQSGPRRGVVELDAADGLGERRETVEYLSVAPFTSAVATNSPSPWRNGKRRTGPR